MPNERLAELWWEIQTMAGPRFYAAANIMEVSYGGQKCGELQ